MGKSKMPPVLGHGWLIDYMKSLGYTADGGGVCFGVCNMGMQAILLDDVDTFDARIKEIHYFSQLSRSQAKARIKEIRKKPDALKNTIEKMQEEIEPFFDGVELYQQALYYPALFEAGKKPITQNTLMVSPLVMPEKLKKQGMYTDPSNHVCGVYTLENLSVYFDSLRTAFTKTKPPLTKSIAFLLTSGDHTIVVGYSPISMEWTLIDPINLPSQRIKDSKVISEKVSAGFSTNGITVFSTEVYCINEQNSINALSESMKQWKNTDGYKSLHSPSQKNREFLYDSDHFSLLLLAAKRGDLKTVRELLNAGADINTMHGRENSALLGNNALLNAVVSGHNEVVNELLNRGANINSINKNGTTALMYAAGKGHLEIVKNLLDRGAKMNLVDTNGINVFLSAALNGHIEVVKELLKRGMSINGEKQDTYTPLMGAVTGGHIDLVILLLANGAKIDINNQNGTSLLFAAVKAGHDDMVELLLKNILENADIYAKNDDDFTLLMFAAQYGHHEIVKRLLICGVKADAYTKNKYTALMYAAENGHTEVVKTLCLANAKPNLDLVNQNGFTALMLAAKNGHDETINVLINHGAKIGRALKVAAVFGHINIVKNLLKAGASLNKADSKGHTAFMLAAQNGQADLVKTLMLNFSEKIDINQTNHEGDTAFMLAARNGHAEVLKVMLAANKEMLSKQTNKKGETALMLAVKKGCCDTVKVLFDSGIEDSDGIKELYVAANMGHYYLVDYLISEFMNQRFSLNAVKPSMLTAVQQGHYDIVNLLLEKKVKLTNVELERIIKAMPDKYFKVLEVFLKNGIIDDKLKNNCLKQAIQKGKLNCIKLFLEHDPNKVSDEIIKFALSSNNPKIIMIIVEKCLREYITDRSAGEDYKEALSFFKSWGYEPNEKYSKGQKLEAAHAFLAVIRGGASISLLKKYSEQLNDGTLKSHYENFQKSQIQDVPYKQPKV